MFIIKVLATFAIIFFLTYALWYVVDSAQTYRGDAPVGKDYIVRYMKLEKVKESICALAGAEIVICLLVVLVGIWV